MMVALVVMVESEETAVVPVVVPAETPMRSMQLVSHPMQPGSALTTIWMPDCLVLGDAGDVVVPVPLMVEMARMATMVIRIGKRYSG